MTRTTPLRCTILHFTQIFLTDALTFMGPLQLLHDPPAAGIDRRELHPNPIAHQHAHEITSDAIGDVRRHHAAGLIAVENALVRFPVSLVANGLGPVKAAVEMREWLERTQDAKPILSKRSAAQIVRELRDAR